MKKNLGQILGSIFRQGSRTASHNISIHISDDDFRKWNPGGETEYLAVEHPGGILLQPVDPPLTKLYLEPTTKCNLQCRTCMRSTWDEQTGDMPVEVFNKLLRGLRTIPTFSTISFWGIGEPLMHPEIIGMIRSANRLGYKTEMITNGLLLDRDMAEGLVDAGLDTLIVSVDGTSSESYLDIRKGSSFATVLANIRHVHEARNRKVPPNPEIGIECVLMKRNLPDLVNLIPVAREMEAAFIILTNLLPYSDDMSDEILYWLAATKVFPQRSKHHPELILPRFDTQQDNMKYLRELLQYCTATVNANSTSGEPDCPFVRKGAAAITWNGLVSPCVPLMHSYSCHILGRKKHITRYMVGDLAHSGIGEIWRSDEYRDFRRRVRSFSFAPCSSCSGCEMADNNLEDCTGAPFPTCGDCLWARGIIVCP